MYSAIFALVFSFITLSTAQVYGCGGQGRIGSLPVYISEVKFQACEGEGDICFFANMTDYINHRTDVLKASMKWIHRPELKYAGEFVVLDSNFVQAGDAGKFEFYQIENRFTMSMRSISSNVMTASFLWHCAGPN